MIDVNFLRDELRQNKSRIKKLDGTILMMNDEIKIRNETIEN